MEKYPRLSQPTHIDLPFARHESLPLIHVSDDAHIFAQLVEARQALHGIYNTPSDNWQCADVANYIRSLNPNIELVFSPSSHRGDPEATNGRRLVEEIGYSPVRLKERLRRSMEH